MKEKRTEGRKNAKGADDEEIDEVTKKELIWV